MSNPSRGVRLSGINGADVLTGGSQDDVLNGGHGDDRLFGLDGNDRLEGGEGNDYLDGGSGHDDLKGGSGNDTLLGGAGNDDIDGGSGGDNADGGAGSDKLKLGSGDDVAIYRMSENTGAHDEYDGGSGHDTLRLEFTASEWANAAVQADVARFLVFLAHHNQAGDDDHGHGGEGGHRFEFAAFHLDVRNFEALRVFVDGVEIDPDAANHAPVLAGANSLNGISEDPTSNMGTTGAALLSGQVSDADGAVQGIAVVAVSGTGGHWEYHDGITWSTLLASVGAALILDATWHVRFVPDLNVQTTTSTTPETQIAEPSLTFHAWDGTSAMAGTVVDLSAAGATGGTTAFSAASATATIAIANVVDAVFTENADTIDLRTFANNPVSDANWFEDLNFLNALGGDDNVFLPNIGSPLFTSYDGFLFTGGDGADTITGGTGADTIDGNADDDTISGGDGDDTLAGGLGIDVLDGGIGDDRFLLATATTTEAVDDTMIGGAGNDMLSFDGTNYTLASFDSSNPAGTASGSGIEAIDLAGARLDGTDDANTFNFSNTTIFFANGDFLAPTVDARGGDDIIVAANQDNLVYVGGAGNDLLVSGTGNDFFIFADGDGDDTIDNFTPGIASDDAIDVSDFGFADFAALDASISDAGGNAIIQLDLEDSITLIGVTKSQLAADDFLI